jgi:prepilin-type N-terminal cleavage/methylation domain-containing protein
MTRSPRDPGGFTLVELTVALGVSSIIVLAAVMSASAIFSMTQGQARRSTAEATLALATVSLDRFASNAGAGFANSRYAVRLRNNVTMSGTSLPSGPSVVVAGSGSAGIVEGTDVLELSWGSPSRRAGRVGPISGPMAPGVTIQFSDGDPLADQEWNGLAPNPAVLLLTRETNPLEACLVQFSNVTTTHSVTVDSFDGTCSFSGTDVIAYKLESRMRLFVYQLAGGADLGLYRQDMDPASTSGSFLAAPEALALGVENLQFALVVGPTPSAPTVSPGVGTCADLLCTCSDVNPAVSDDCTVTEGGGISPATAPDGMSSLVRAVNAEVTVVGDRREGQARPASFDRPGGAVDNRRRVLSRVSFNIVNGMLFAQ